MFGFEKARKAKQLRFACNRVKGMSLVEVVEEYGIFTSIAEPTIPYDHEVAKSMTVHMDELFRKGVLEPWDDLEEELLRYCNDNGLDGDASHMYHALSLSRNLVTVVRSELRMEFEVEKEGYVEDYFFNSFLGEFIPHFYLVPILFPAKKGNQTQTFRISDSNRNKLIDAVFSRLGDLDQFRDIVSEFALNHRYFRDYPVA